MKHFGMQDHYIVKQLSQAKQFIYFSVQNFFPE